MECTSRTPEPPRKTRRPKYHLQERLARCEQLLKQFAGSAVLSAGAFQTTASTSPDPMTASTYNPRHEDMPQATVDYIEGSPIGKMIQQDGHPRVMVSQLGTMLQTEAGALKFA